ncbi:uncharacterized protein F5147DRAFT_650091 [Suillus discolor]|uniref:Uncharacterized protein n=1 Tax=Suillus discolor TaxID=1912936 RepID=A0A9P7FFL0_9AGAM|nr:uncharacterized protein F5147DRAFT_650091 [Suillus discolor]KAG2114311.1 hypothetical protein F5147DRAFT_650091 [Suillus discolor]
METDYSADDIAAAMSLQFFQVRFFFCRYEAGNIKQSMCASVHIHPVSITTFWWRFLLVSHWTKAKGLYIATRYVPFLLLATNLYLSFIPNETPGKCRVLDNICSGFFILRTCALWNNNRILLAAILVTLSQTFLGASIGITFATTAPATYAISAIPGITGCYQSSSSLQLFIPFLLLCAFELGLMTLTLIRAIQSWRQNPSRLYIVLLNHNIFYYTCGLLLSVANIFTSLLLHYSYHAILHDFQFIILAILATRMHRHLWQMKRQSHGSDAPMQIPMSDMSPPESKTTYLGREMPLVLFNILGVNFSVQAAVDGLME